MQLHSKDKFTAKLELVRLGRSTCFCCGGGDSGGGASAMQDYYSQMMGDQAKAANEQFNKWTPALNDQYTNLLNSDSPEERAKLAGLAQADVASSFGNQREQSARQMASMGIDPSSGAWANNDAKMRMAEAAAGAGAQNMARNAAMATGKEDRLNFMRGVSGQQLQANNSAQNAANSYGVIATNQMQAAQNDSANMGSAVQGGMDIAQLWNDWGKKDGGYISSKGERHLAAGGIISNNIKPKYNPDVVNARKAYTPEQDPAMQALDVAKTAKKGYDLYGKLTAPAATGLAAMEGSAPIMAAEYAAPAIATEAATAAAGAEAAGAAAGAEAAGAAGASGLLGTVGAAMPLVGAGLLVANALGIFDADGGAISKDDPRLRKDLRKGGKVKGKGTETSDSIPAHLSDGEYVLNSETVKMIGKDKLDKLNAAGLARRYGVKGARA